MWTCLTMGYTSNRAMLIWIIIQKTGGFRGDGFPENFLIQSANIWPKSHRPWILGNTEPFVAKELVSPPSHPMWLLGTHRAGRTDVYRWQSPSVTLKSGCMPCIFAAIFQKRVAKGLWFDEFWRFNRSKQFLPFCLVESTCLVMILMVTCRQNHRGWLGEIRRPVTEMSAQSCWLRDKLGTPMQFLWYDRCWELWNKVHPVCQLAKSRQQSLFNTRWCPSSFANLVPITPVSRLDEWGVFFERVFLGMK